MTNFLDSKLFERIAYVEAILEGDNRAKTATILAEQREVVGRMFEALENLTFTASKLWNDAKPIKDGAGITVTHPIIEDAKAALAAARGGE